MAPRQTLNSPGSPVDGGGPVLESVGTPTSEGRVMNVVLVGHHPVMLYGLKHLLAKESDCAVVAVTTDPERIFDTVRGQQTDIVVIDLKRNSTFALLRRLQREQLRVRVVVLVAAADQDGVVGAAQLGASAVVLKELPPEAVLTCIRSVHRGEQVIPRRSGSRGGTSIKPGASPWRVSRELTPREAEIARLAAQGTSTTEIAARLELKQGTVKIHLHSVYTKLKVNGRLGLMIFAQRHGLA